MYRRNITTWSREKLPIRCSQATIETCWENWWVDVIVSIRSSNQMMESNQITDHRIDHGIKSDHRINHRINQIRSSNRIIKSNNGINYTMESNQIVESNHQVASRQSSSSSIRGPRMASPVYTWQLKSRKKVPIIQKKMQILWAYWSMAVAI